MAALFEMNRHVYVVLLLLTIFSFLTSTAILESPVNPVCMPFHYGRKPEYLQAQGDHANFTELQTTVWVQTRK